MSNAKKAGLPKQQVFIFVSLAVTSVASADTVHRYLRWVTGRQKPPKPFPAPLPLGQWLLLYRRHRVVRGETGTLFGLPDRTSANGCLDAIHHPEQPTQEELLDELEALSEEELARVRLQFAHTPFPPTEGVLRYILAELEADASVPDSSDDDPFDSFMDSPSGQFLFRVWLPCWLLYRDLPGRLLRRARLGDQKALDQLIRLDTSVIHDPVIAERVHTALHSGVKRDRDLIVNAIAGKPTVKLDARKVKYGLAGMLSQFAKESGMRVTAPEIADLFDAIEKIRTDSLRDGVIPAGDTFARAIQRNRDWPMGKLT